MILSQYNPVNIAFFFVSVNLDSFQLIDSFGTDLSSNALFTDYTFLAFDLNKVLIRTNIFGSVLYNNQYVRLRSDRVIYGFSSFNIRL